ncbi:hypothetical protein J6590_099053 [Homalodisca vitripennis]|nr:hypothetical protein J6590_099053 [Homalodisca vitripennis]
MNTEDQISRTARLPVANIIIVCGEPALRVIQTGLQEQERSRCRPRKHALLPFRVEKR